MTEYLTIQDALAVVKSYGFYLRDGNVNPLASCLERPATTLMGEDVYVGLHIKAAALLESVNRAHAIIEGNKRTAWTLMVLFLWINGYKHDFTADQGEALCKGIAERRIDMEDVAAQIAAHMIPR